MDAGALSVSCTAQGCREWLAANQGAYHSCHVSQHGSKWRCRALVDSGVRTLAT